MVKCGVRVLSARASHFSLVPDLLFDCSPVLEYARIRTVLQSTVTGAFGVWVKLSSNGFSADLTYNGNILVS